MVWSKTIKGTHFQLFPIQKSITTSTFSLLSNRLPNSSIPDTATFHLFIPLADAASSRQDDNSSLSNTRTACLPPRRLPSKGHATGHKERLRRTQETSLDCTRHSVISSPTQQSFSSTFARSGNLPNSSMPGQSRVFYEDSTGRSKRWLHSNKRPKHSRARQIRQASENESTRPRKIKSNNSLNTNHCFREWSNPRNRQSQQERTL